MSPLQKGRWQEVLESRKDLAQQKGLDPDFVEKIWQLIHEYSLNIQEKI
jgi:chorismate mutase